MVRNRVTRRLRAIMAEELRELPSGSNVVIRALPPAAAASFDELQTDVTGAVRRALTKVNA